MVSAILQNPKVNINKTDRYGVNAFWITSFYGHIEIMRMLMARGIDILCKNMNGSNALHIAAKKGNLTVLQALIDINYPLDHEKNNGVTAAGIAAFSGNLRVLDLLVKAGADINRASKKGTNPLYLAIKANNYECMRYLINKKAYIHLREPSQQDHSPIFFSIKQGNLQAVRGMLEEGVILDKIKNFQGYNPLQYAMLCKQMEVADILIDSTQLINEEDPEGLTALTRALLILNDFSLSQKLIAKGANINLRNSEGETPLILAIVNSNEAAVKFLLQKGANPHLENNQGNDACFYANRHAIFSKYAAFINCDKHFKVGKKPQSKSTSPNRAQKPQTSTMPQTQYRLPQDQDSDQYKIVQSIAPGTELEGGRDDKMVIPLEKMASINQIDTVLQKNTSPPYQTSGTTSAMKKSPRNPKKTLEIDQEKRRYMSSGRNNQTLNDIESPSRQQKQLSKQKQIQQAYDVRESLWMHDQNNSSLQSLQASQHSLSRERKRKMRKPWMQNDQIPSGYQSEKQVHISIAGTESNSNIIDIQSQAEDRYEGEQRKRKFDSQQKITIRKQEFDRAERYNQKAAAHIENLKKNIENDIKASDEYRSKLPDISSKVRDLDLETLNKEIQQKISKVVIRYKNPLLSKLSDLLASGDVVPLDPQPPSKGKQHQPTLPSIKDRSVSPIPNHDYQSTKYKTLNKETRNGTSRNLTVGKDFSTGYGLIKNSSHSKSATKYQGYQNLKFFDSLLLHPSLRELERQRREQQATQDKPMVEMQQQPPPREHHHHQEQQNRTSRKNYSKASLRGPNGEFIFHTELRALQRKKPCCSHSHSPNHHHHHSRSQSHSPRRSPKRSPNGRTTYNEITGGIVHHL